MTTRRILVTDKKQQPKLIRQAYANHNPIITMVHEIGHHGDADAIASTITNVVNTPIFWPMMGAVREQGYLRQRMTEPPFDIAVEVRGVGRFVIHDDVTAAVDQIIAGEVPGGKRFGQLPNLRTGSIEPGSSNKEQGVSEHPLAPCSRRGACVPASVCHRAEPHLVTCRVRHPAR